MAACTRCHSRLANVRHGIRVSGPRLPEHVKPWLALQALPDVKRDDDTTRSGVMLADALRGILDATCDLWAPLCRRCHAAWQHPESMRALTLLGFYGPAWFSHARPGVVFAFVTEGRAAMLAALEAAQPHRLTNVKPFTEAERTTVTAMWPEVTP